MGSSSRGDHDNSNRVSFSSSKYLSLSPSSLHPLILRNPRRKSIEEVWSNINRTCIHHNSNTSSSGRVEEFNPIPKTKTTSSTFPNINNLQDNHQKQQLKRTLLPRLTIDLNSVDCCNEDNTEPYPRLNHNNSLSFIDSTTTSFVSAWNTSHPLQQQAIDDNTFSVDLSKHKKMINSRESAARSRARKKAYTDELELQLDKLMKENAMLRKQQQQFYSAAAAHEQPMETITLQRTSTAPF